MHAVNHHPNDTCDTDALNSLLRGELSAVETYDQAKDKFTDDRVLADLETIREEHARAVGVLRDMIVHFGGEPATGSGPWGTFTAAVTGAAKAIGPATALAALRQGEEHGINEYDDALGNEGINPQCKDLIRTQLLPVCRKHVEELNRLMGGMK